MRLTSATARPRALFKPQSCGCAEMCSKKLKLKRISFGSPLRFLFFGSKLASRGFRAKLPSAGKIQRLLFARRLVRFIATVICLVARTRAFPCSTVASVRRVGAAFCSPPNLRTGKAQPTSTVQMAEDILCGLDGKPVCLELLSSAVGQKVTSIEVVPGSENKFPTSHSAILSLSGEDGRTLRKLFVKKVSAEAMKHKAWADRRRTLAYSRTEMRFYKEFAPELVARGVNVPRLAATVDCLGPLLGEDSAVADPPGDEPPEEVLNQGGGMLFLECAPQHLTQCSPISAAQARAALTTIAGMHAAAWGDEALLSPAAARLQQYGGSFSLSIRNPKELAKLCSNWERFVAVFGEHNPTLFQKPSVLALGSRLEAISSWVAAELQAPPRWAGPHLEPFSFFFYFLRLALATG